MYHIIRLAIDRRVGGAYWCCEECSGTDWLSPKHDIDDVLCRQLSQM